MAAFMVDYENVNASNGLKGVEYLEKKDSLHIFYSRSCEKIKSESMDYIIRSGCQFHIYKLKNIGKNALDFYIASQIGECIGSLSEHQIVIISKDKGFRAVSDFWSIKKESELRIVLAANIEQGIIQLNEADDQERCKIIRQKVRTLDLSVEYEKYRNQIETNLQIAKAFVNTKYVEQTETICKLVNAVKGKGRKALYTTSLHTFGRVAGREIYNVLKEYQNGCNMLESRELSIPDSVSAKTLADMDKAIENFKDGNVSSAIDLSDF